MGEVLRKEFGILFLTIMGQLIPLIVPRNTCPLIDIDRVPNMFASHYKQEHSARKKMLSGLYAKAYLHKSEPLQAQASQILFNRLLPKLAAAASTETVRLKP